MIPLAAEGTVRLLALHEDGGHHIAFSRRARVWLDALADERGFAVDYRTATDPIDDAFLGQHAAFLQLDFPPHGWKPEAAAAFERYIDEGRGGWVGLHHASLLGEFDGFPMWDWFSRFLGGIRYRNYIPTFADATVVIEKPEHPLLQDVPSTFLVAGEEWYIYDRSPRESDEVEVLAHVDRSCYVPDSPVKMGDHPVIWTNRRVGARNVYLFMGHSPDLFDNPAYTTLLRNAVLWAAGIAPDAGNSPSNFGPPPGNGMV